MKIRTKAADEIGAAGVELPVLTWLHVGTLNQEEDRSKKFSIELFIFL